MSKKLFAIIFLLPASAAAQDISTDRPDQTEAPFVIPQKTIQLECGFLHEKNGRLKNAEIPSLLWRFSLSEVMELRLITTHVNNNIRNESMNMTGLNRFSLDLKLRFVKKKAYAPMSDIFNMWLSSGWPLTILRLLLTPPIFGLLRSIH